MKSKGWHWKSSSLESSVSVSVYVKAGDQNLPSFETINVSVFESCMPASLLVVSLSSQGP